MFASRLSTLHDYTHNASRPGSLEICTPAYNIARQHQHLIRYCTAQLLLFALPFQLLLLPQHFVFCSQLLHAGQQVATRYQKVLLQQLPGC